MKNLGKLYEELDSRGTVNSKKYAGILLPIADEIGDFLQYIKSVFPDYPDHGINHSLRITDYIASILGSSVKKLTDKELFCFIMSALFHDTGMSLVGYDSKDNLRVNHHYNASVVIDKYFAERLSILKSGERIANVVKFVCEAHNLALDELYEDWRFSREDTIDGDCVRYDFLAILLRIGDLMDLEEKRVNSFAVKMFPDSFSEEALDHNTRHLKIDCYNYNSEKLSIEVSPDNIKQHKIWLTWFEYLKNDILRANTHLRTIGIGFPFPNTLIKTSQNADYSAEEIRFEIDDKGGIWNILSQSIYTNELDFLREIVQNAIDATLMTVYDDIDIDLKCPSPRSWNTQTHCEDVMVCYCEKKKELFVIDHGIGMDSTDLRNFLFKVSNSGYSNANKRDFPFPSIAKYGIGFVSCLICADEIEIFTSKSDESVAHKVSLDTKSNLAFMENFSLSDFKGTIIALKLKHDFTFKKISEYIQNTFLYPSVGITIVNLDAMFVNIRNMCVQLEYNSIRNSPVSLINTVSHISERQKRHIAPFEEKLSLLKEISFNTENLKMRLNKIYEYNSRYSISSRISDFKNCIKAFLDSISDTKIKEKFISIPIEINEREFYEKERFYTEMLDDFSDFVQDEMKTVYTERQEYPDFKINVESIPVTFGLENKYMMVFLDEYFSVESVKLSDEPVNISDKQGIIFMNHSYKDFESGLEYEAINGFLFCKGKIFNSLVKVTGEHRVPFMEKKERYFVVDSNGYTSVKDAVCDMVGYDTYDSDNEPMFLYSRDSDSYELGIMFNKACDVVFIKNNIFMKDNGVDIDDIDSNSLGSFGRPISLSSYYTKLTDEDDVQILTLWDRIDRAKNIYCQDGIVVSDELSALFPVGYFKIICNTTFEARKVLNVTRHETSGMRSDIDSWFEKSGYKLQQSLVKEVTEMLNAFNLEFDFLNMDKNCLKDDYFSQQCSYNFDKTLFKEK